MKHASLLRLNANAFLSDNKENLKGIHIALAKYNILCKKGLIRDGPF